MGAACSCCRDLLGTRDSDELDLLMGGGSAAAAAEAAAAAAHDGGDAAVFDADLFGGGSDGSGSLGSRADAEVEGDDAAPPSPSPSATVCLEDYERLKLLGQGDVGRVYLVRHRPTDRLCAMKVMLKSDMVARNKVQRALTEYAVLTTARHPFIVSLYQAFQTTNKLYLVMEYCAGGEFFRMLQRRPDHRLGEQDARFYLAEIVSALEYLHIMGFVYRDLKPENVLLHASGHIRLADFDLSKRGTRPGIAALAIPRSAPGKKRRRRRKLEAAGTGDGSDATDSEGESRSGGVDTSDCVLVKTNSFVGTEEYIAPEVIEGAGHSSLVDWWSLGVLTYEMLYGTTPFRGRDRDATFEQIVEGELRFAEHPVVSPAAKDLMRALLERDERHRLGSLRGALDIKEHPFFHNVRWQMLHHARPPLVPHLSHPLDTSCFRIHSGRLSEWGASEVVVEPSALDESDPFRGFAVVSR